MKSIKYLFLTVCAIVLIPSAFGQGAGVRFILSGGTTVLPGGVSGTNMVVLAGVTNQYGSPNAVNTITPSNLVQSVAEYDTVGITWRITGHPDTTNGAINLKVFKSYDNGVYYEAVPSYIFSKATPLDATTGAKTYMTNTTLSVSGATHIAFISENLSVGLITNALLEINLKRTGVYNTPSRN